MEHRGGAVTDWPGWPDQVETLDGWLEHFRPAQFAEHAWSCGAWTMAVEGELAGNTYVWDADCQLVGVAAWLDVDDLCFGTTAEVRWGFLPPWETCPDHDTLEPPPCAGWH